jgi:hypothetical protein
MYASKAVNACQHYAAQHANNTQATTRTPHLLCALQAKAGRRWRVLELLKPNWVPQQPQPQQSSQPPQQQQQQHEEQQLQQRTPYSSSSSSCSQRSSSFYIPGMGSTSALPAICKATLRQHPSQQQQWLPRRQPGLGYEPLFRMFEGPLWQQHGNAQSYAEMREIQRVTEALAEEVKCKNGITYVDR